MLASDVEWFNAAQWAVRRIAVSTQMSFACMFLWSAEEEEMLRDGRSCPELEASLFPASKICTSGKCFSQYICGGYRRSVAHL